MTDVVEASRRLREAFAAATTFEGPIDVLLPAVRTRGPGGSFSCDALEAYALAATMSDRAAGIEASWWDRVDALDEEARRVVLYWSEPFLAALDPAATWSALRARAPEPQWVAIDVGAHVVTAADDRGDDALVEHLLAVNEEVSGALAGYVAAARALRGDPRGVALANEALSRGRAPRAADQGHWVAVAVAAPETISTSIRERTFSTLGLGGEALASFASTIDDEAIATIARTADVVLAAELLAGALRADAIDASPARSLARELAERIETELDAEQWSDALAPLLEACAGCDATDTLRFALHLYCPPPVGAAAAFAEGLRARANRDSAGALRFATTIANEPTFDALFTEGDIVPAPWPDDPRMAELAHRSTPTALKQLLVDTMTVTAARPGATGWHHPLSGRVPWRSRRR